MLLKPECILCNYRVCLSALRQLTSDEPTIKELLADILQIPALRGLDWSLTSPEVFEVVFQKLVAAFGQGDPFRDLKERQNEKGLELYPWLKSLIAESEDPLRTAASLAAIGNSLDLMWSEGSIEVEALIRKGLSYPVPLESFRELEKRLKKATLLLYFGDNSGEIVFDRLFVETLKQHTDLEVTFVVRSVPTLNDVTLVEAKHVQMDECARLVENGIEGPLPGTIIARCSQELRQLVKEADLIVSKGGGNFDSLDEERVIETDVCFLLMCKCIPYRDYFNTDLYRPILHVRSYKGAGLEK